MRDVKEQTYGTYEWGLCFANHLVVVCLARAIRLCQGDILTRLTLHLHVTNWGQSQLARHSACVLHLETGTPVSWRKQSSDTCLRCLLQETITANVLALIYLLAVARCADAARHVTDVVKQALLQSLQLLLS